MHPIEENMEKALKYFDIPESEIIEGFYITSNNKKTREVMGISAVEESCKEGGKFRITSYYAPEFPSIVTCVTKYQ